MVMKKYLQATATREKTFKYNNFNVKVKLFLIGSATSSKKYEQYWCNNIDDMEYIIRIRWVRNEVKTQY